MNIKLFKETLGFGIFLWFFGYILGIILFMVVPSSLLGWIIMPFGIALTVWVLFKKIRLNTFKQYLNLAIVWATIAIIFDYFLLVKIFNPTDGYYKLDVYLYYVITFLLPILVGWYKIRSGGKK